VIRNEELERFILGFALEIQHDGFGRPTSIAALQVAASQKCCDTDRDELLDALYNLQPDNAALIKFRPAGGGVSEQLEFETVRREPDWHNFFMIGSFNIKVLPPGRIRLQQLSEANAADADFKFARMAVNEARKSVPENDGKPHPWVGAVVVKDGKVLSTAHRGEVPGNHAEFTALERNLSDIAVAGATVYATLEPCTTRNRPKIPCADRLIERRIKRVVIGMLDPDDRIRGKGHRKLTNAGIEFSFFPHDLAMEVEELNRDFTRFCEQNVRTQVGSVNMDLWKEVVGLRTEFAEFKQNVEAREKERAEFENFPATFRLNQGVPNNYIGLLVNVSK
jgi:pyrimidine deaminase RibD-like protein